MWYELNPWVRCAFGNVFLFYNFMLKKPCLKVQILQYKFWIKNDPPPFWNFSENSSVLVAPTVPK